MKKNLFIPILALLLLAGCDYNEKYFDGLDEASRPTNVFSKEYTLADADYAAIANNATNKSIATSEGTSAQLAKLGTDLYFSGSITAEKYIPAFLAGKYYTADNGAAVKVTYNQKNDLPEYMVKLNAAKIYTLAAGDYQGAWGEGSDLNFFTPSKPASNYLPAVLAAKVENANAGDIVCASYNFSENEPADVTIAFSEDFEGIVSREDINLADWSNITVAGSLKWQGRSFDGNLYANQSAYQHAGDLDSYLISKEITVEKGMLLTFDALYANYVTTGGTISILVTTDMTDNTPEGIAAATWTDLTGQFVIPTASSGTGDMQNVGNADLSAYINKKIRIAFRYQGNGDTKATSTIRLDNVAISTPGKNVYALTNVLYSYSGTAWTAYTANNSIMLGLAEFAEMGSRYDNFSSTMNADNYLPTFLQRTYPYTQEGDFKVPVYKFYNSTTKVTSIRADKYDFTGGKFIKDTSVEVLTSQFVLSNGKWSFDPSTVITLNTTKNDPVSVPFYNAIIAWVKANESGYVNSYGDSEFYYGATSYNNNISFSLSSWRAQNSSAYGGLTDDQLRTLMFERLPEAFPHALEVLYADADVVSGIEVTYTVNFSIYDGTATSPYTIQYLVTGKGKFEYIEGSLKKL